MDKILKTSLLISILLIFGCNNSDEQNEIQQLDCLPTGLQNGVVAFYPFNSGSINDESGNNNNLANTTTASATIDRNGNTNCAYQFNSNNNEFLTLSNPTFLNGIQSGGFSISMWYLSENEGAGLMSRGNDFGNCAGGIGEWNLSLWDNNWPVFFINSYRSIGVTPNPEIVQLNEWHHLVVTSDITDLKIYQDGILIEDNENVICNSGPTPSLNMGDLFIGEFLSGKLDDIIIYNILLTQTEITELYNLTPCCS
ncbi:LamG domain-containing protein [Winogradskyella maritima]|uniref:LamG domain-containing protein n=1 Tax=Winogradskyella maritima TaxID=1517766 RepID=A0ABV8AJB6_9FLAO|nr:LamG domain-containing protein [Winogradskyella maritima]